MLMDKRWMLHFQKSWNNHLPLCFPAINIMIAKLITFRLNVTGFSLRCSSWLQLTGVYNQNESINTLWHASCHLMATWLCQCSFEVRHTLSHTHSTFAWLCRSSLEIQPCRSLMHYSFHIAGHSATGTCQLKMDSFCSLCTIFNPGGYTD